MDLDGVLADFVTAVGAHYQIPIYTDTYPISVGWNLLKAVHRYLDISASDFWDGLDYNFWANIQHYVGAKTFLQAVEKFGEVYICTSDTLHSDSAKGKVDWITHHFPRYSRRRLIGPCKHILAGPNVILIDDCDKNVDAFREAGGKAILVPRPWNTNNLHSGYSYLYTLKALNETCKS